MMKTLTGKEHDLLFDMFEFYSLNKLDKDIKNVSVFFDQLYETGNIGDSGDLYVESKPLHDLKQVAVNNIQSKKTTLIELRNKLLTL